MNGIKAFMKIFVVFLLTSCLSSCTEDTPPLVQAKEVKQIIDMINEESLLVNVESVDSNTKLIFETGYVMIPSNQIESIIIDKKHWNTTLHLASETLQIPTLGDNLDDVVRKIILDPTGYCPLAAEIQLSFPVKGRVRVIVEGRNGESGNIDHLFLNYGYNQSVTVLGLYPNYNNKVVLVLTDKQGRERMRTMHTIQTRSLTDLSLPKVRKIKSIPEKIEKGMTMIAYMGANEFDTSCPFMIDADGEVRWLLKLNEHPELKHIQTHTGLQRLRNGNMVCGHIKTGQIIEIDILGNVKNKWSIKSLGYEFHHEVTEMPNGNFLITVSESKPNQETGKLTIYDVIIELGRESGNLVAIWDLKKSLDPQKRTFIDFGDYREEDCIHNNAVLYSETDDCIIVSTRYQGLVKLDRLNHVKWLLAPHKRDSTDKDMSGALLNPITTSGALITSVDVKNGEARTSDFDWSWGGHNPVFMPNGNILMFDNGYYRQYKGGHVFESRDEDLYSRAVEYKIDESKKTVQQVWQYGQQRKRECWSLALSSVQYLPETKNVLFSPGVGAICQDGFGGKIVEVNYITSEVVLELDITRPSSSMVFHRAKRMNLYPD